MSYDPNWLQKEKTKQINRELANLSHIMDGNQALCGKGFGAKGHPSIRTIQFPSIDSLPGCRSCREKFLTSIGVEFDSKGYPITK